MKPKNVARLLVIVVALAAALALLAGKIPFLMAIGAVLIANAGVVSWLKWHEELPDHRR